MHSFTFKCDLMKKLFSTLALSLTALLTTTAMAAPHHNTGYTQNQPTHSRYASHHTQQQATHFDRHYHAEHDQHRRFEQHHRFEQQRVNPSQDWRSGQYLPTQFSASHYKVGQREAKKLSKTHKNQQWYKINGDYVLVNEKNRRIVQILG